MALTLRGCAMLPTTNMSSLVGCQTAWNLLSQRPVKLLCLKSGLKSEIKNMFNKGKSEMKNLFNKGCM